MSGKHILDYFTRPAPMTSAGRHAPRFDALPSDAGSLARVAQGLVVHEFVARPFYGFKVPTSRAAESHIRSVEALLDRLLALDSQPLAVPRPVKKRLVGVCHHFMLLLVAILRAKGVPARARCGFGSYFNPGFFEDHWVCEYWDAGEERWVLVDPQFDEVWRRKLKIDHDVLDVPRDRFLVAADAWTKCRAGDEDPATFGIFKGDQRGLWFIATDLIHDVAALNKVEMLPWDVWGAMPHPDETMQSEQLEFFDRLAQLTGKPDESFVELRELYNGDDRVRVPSTVFNAVLNRPEVVEFAGQHAA